MKAWSLRRWVVAAVVAVATVLIVGVPTDLIGTPLFSREIPPTWWAWPALALNSVLTGLLVATYVRPVAEGGARSSGRAGGVGGALTFFAVGCPVCNKIVLVMLGTSGALRWFEPIQPVLSVLASVLLAGALWWRVRGESRCRLPAGP